MWKMNPASCAVTRITRYFHNIELGHATGFLYSYGQTLALVSNWHVFSGRHPETGEALHGTGCTPNRVEFHISVADCDKKGTSIEFRPITLPLSRDGQPLWWQHRGYLDPASQPHHVDIGVLPLDDFAKIEKRILSFDALVVVKGWRIRALCRFGSVDRLLLNLCSILKAIFRSST